MWTFLLILAVAIPYIGIAASMFGYVRGALEDKENGWETPIPVASAVFWPLALTFIALRNIMVPAEKLGYAVQRKQLESKKKRIEQQEKIRVELQKVEKEIEEAYQDLEQEEMVKKTGSMRHSR